MRSCLRRCLWVCLGILWEGGLTHEARANHEIQRVHRLFRDQIRELDEWYRESLDGIRCEFDGERESIEQAMRDARRLREPERGHYLEVLRHAMDDLHCRYRSEKRRVHERYECRRDEIHAWFRAARREVTERRRNEVRFDVPGLGPWGRG